jgi:organic radical activating enzyme
VSAVNKKTDNDQFLNFKKDIIDPISPSFCAAKWYNATIWLFNGKTTSCHHPPHHDIPTENLDVNPSLIHNTVEKKDQRKRMLAGERPKGCEYCWVLEDMDKDAISDRVFKTNIYTKEEIQACKTLGFDSDVELKTLEIAFDRTCNFACAYCNATYSTKWSQDISKNGPYLGLRHRDAGTYRMDGNEFTFKGDSEDNPYIKAFWQWWPKLTQSLQELRITGGEPLMSIDCWKVIDYFEKNGSGDMVFAINTNLGARDDLVEKLIDKSQYINKFDLYTSCESTGSQAEYVRDGLDYEKFISNLEKCITSGNFKSINVMMTVSSLCLFNITEFLDKMMYWKERYGTHKPTWTVNLLRFPAFMSGVNLPDHLKKACQIKLINWLDENKNHHAILPHEIAGLERLIDYLAVVDKPHRLATKGEINHKDLRMFLRQYDKRRGKDFRKTFPNEFVEWIDSI